MSYGHASRVAKFIRTDEDALIGQLVDWESCARVLADDARRRSLTRGWTAR